MSSPTPTAQDETRHDGNKSRFTLRSLLLVTGLCAASFGLIRTAFLLWSTAHAAGGIAGLVSFLVGAHLLAATIGGSIGGFVRGRPGAVDGAAVAIVVLWLLGSMLFPGVNS